MGEIAFVLFCDFATRFIAVIVWIFALISTVIGQVLLVHTMLVLLVHSNCLVHNDCSFGSQ